MSLCSPRGEVIGGLLFRSFKPYAYTDEDVRLAERIGNQIAGAIANAQLFLKQKQTEEALRESEERFRQVAENVGDFIWEVDAKGCTVTRARPWKGFSDTGPMN